MRHEMSDVTNYCAVTNYTKMFPFGLRIRVGVNAHCPVPSAEPVPNATPSPASFHRKQKRRSPQCIDTCTEGTCRVRPVSGARSWLERIVTAAWPRSRSRSGGRGGEQAGGWRWDRDKDGNRTGQRQDKEWGESSDAHNFVRRGRIGYFNPMLQRHRKERSVTNLTMSGSSVKKKLKP